MAYVTSESIQDNFWNEVQQTFFTYIILISVKGEEVTATCQGNDELKVNQYYLHFEDVKCTKSVQASVRSLSRKCEEDGNSYEIGFNLEDINDWLPLIFICYNEVKGAALYSFHLLHGKEIKCKLTEFQYLCSCMKRL